MSKHITVTNHFLSDQEKEAGKYGVYLTFNDKPPEDHEGDDEIHVKTCADIGAADMFADILAGLLGLDKDAVCFL